MATTAAARPTPTSTTAATTTISAAGGAPGEGGTSSSLPTTSSTSLPIPKEWPTEVSDLYEPIQMLGKGGFASVVLARQRRRPQGGNEDNKSPSYAAIKIVGSDEASLSRKRKKQQLGYAHREFEVLAELQHPNIVTLVHRWKNETTGIVVMALSYARGPTLQALLVRGGAVSLVFARIVAAQLIDAISYLHSRAVLHRDIKPDNCIVTGATYTQTEIWDDSFNLVPLQDMDPTNDSSDNPTTGPWAQLLSKWHLTLVDFGFARALSPGDMRDMFATTNAMTRTTGTATVADASTSSNPSNHNTSNHNSLRISMDGSTTSSTTSTGRRRRNSQQLDRSMSRRFTRMMSAVGNRAYAAPEVQTTIVVTTTSSADPNSSRRSWTDDVSSSFGRRLSISRHRRASYDVTQTLSDHVSHYGLNADAYSVGCTLKHMLTGMRPDQDVNQTLDLENAPIVVLCRWLCNALSYATASNNDHQRKQYRRFSDIPPEVQRLITGLTHRDPHQRTTIRTARLYPYIDDVLVSNPNYDDGPMKNRTYKSIDYLQCVLRRYNNNDNTTTNQPTQGLEQDSTHPNNTMDASADAVVVESDH